MTQSKRAAETPMKVRWVPTGFGLAADLDAVTPADCNIVVLCVMGGEHAQLHPVDVRLPHQVYWKDCQKLLREERATEIVIIPAVSTNYVELGTLARQRKGRKS